MAVKDFSISTQSSELEQKLFRLKIIIIGAGLSGLTAAIQCALSGHSVLVLEQAKELAEVCAHISSRFLFYSLSHLYTGNVNFGHLS